LRNLTCRLSGATVRFKISHTTSVCYGLWPEMKAVAED